MRIETPILYLASVILFYVIFLFVPYIVIFLQKDKYFNGCNNLKIFLSIFKFQLIFLFFTILVPFVLLSIFSGSILDIFVDKDSFIFLLGLPVFIVISFIPILSSLNFSSLESWIILLLAVIVFESWRRLSLWSLKKSLSAEDKTASKNVLISIVGAVLMLFFVGFGILLLLHSVFFYCPGDILCERTDAYYNFKR